MMKEPIEGDFDVKVEGANVRVTFNPTSGRFTFNSKSILGDPKEKATIQNVYCRGDWREHWLHLRIVHWIDIP